MTLLDPKTITQVRPRRRIGRPSWLFRSLISKLAFLIVVFLTVPIIVYTQFQQADSDKRQLLLDSVREQGRLLAEGLRPTLEREDPSPLLALPEEIVRLVTPHTGVKVLFRPKGAQGAETFFLVAVEPAVPPAELEAERDRMLQRGVLDNLGSTCEGKLPVALRHSRPQGEELLTSITPITTSAGCWAVVTAHSSGAFLGTSIGQPYWQTFEVRIAAESYLIMAAITISVVFGIWHSLTRFGRLARKIRTGTAPTESFEAQNRVPELAVVAGEFDRMTQSLQSSADDLRRAAEDNAHAFKTPIAIIRQSLEPLDRHHPPVPRALVQNRSRGLDPRTARPGGARDRGGPARPTGGRRPSSGRSHGRVDRSAAPAHRSLAPDRAHAGRLRRQPDQPSGPFDREARAQGDGARQ
jgi:two-component system sensor histidine kinase ChvG